MKTITNNEEKRHDSIELEICGVQIQLNFTEKEEPGIKDLVIEILSNSYEKRRLGETSGYNTGKI